MPDPTARPSRSPASTSDEAATEATTTGVAHAPTPGDRADVDRADDRATPDSAGPVQHLVEWEATARRLRRSSVVLLGAGLVAWVVTSVVESQWSLAGLGNWLGLALLAMFVAEVVVVGGSAVRGLLRAGDAGERLSSNDVGLFPPTPRRRSTDD